MWYKNIAGRFFGLVTKHACVRQTDGQNYDSQDRASIAASRGKTAEPIEMPFRMWTRMNSIKEACIKPWFHAKIKLF